MNRWKSVALSVGLGTIIGVGGVFVVEPRLPTSPTVRGLQVAGQPLAHGTDPTAFVEQLDTAFRATPVVLVHGDHRFETNYGALGASIDVPATVSAVRAIGHSGSVVKRLRETGQALRGEIDVPVVHDFDHALASGVIRQSTDALSTKPTNAELDLVAHAKIPDVPGQELDVATTLEAFEKELTAGEPATLSFVTKVVEAEITLNDLEDIDVTKVLAKFETRFRPWKKGRTANVHLAAKNLNGMIIRPRQTVSFNERVGPRSVDAGFQKAPEIVGDELTIGIGGGTCQVSSTLYGAAIYGGFKVVERRSHSRPSSYTRLGLDATVAYPKVDLKLMNPFNFTIVVHALVPEKGLLRVELLGGEAVSSVEYRYGISNIEQYVRRITVKPWLKPGRVFRKQKGTRGMDVHSHVKIFYNDGRFEERQYYSGYRATPEVYWVAGDYDEQELPPLPDHAKGVEGRLEDDGSDVYPTNG